MKRQRAYLAASAAAVILLTAGLGWFHWGRQGQDEADMPRATWEVLIQGSSQEARGMATVFKRFADSHPEFNPHVRVLFDDASLPPESDFQLLVGSRETLAGIRKKLQPLPVEFSEGQGPENILIWDDEIYGLPLYEHKYVTLYYDKRRIQPARDWLQLADQLEAKTQRLTLSYGLAMGETVRMAHPFFLKKDGKSLTAEESRVAYGRLNQLRHMFAVMPLNCNEVCAEATFKQGRASMLLADDEIFDSLAASLGQENLGILPLPQDKDSVLHTARQSVFLALGSIQGKKQEKLVETLIEWLHSPEGQNAIFASTRKVPSMALVQNMALEDELGQSLVHYLKQSSVPLSLKAYENFTHQLNKSLPAYLSGSVGESEAAMQLVSTP